MNIVVKQHDFKDCGICCLLSIIKYYRGYVPLNVLRIDACVTKEGTTAYHLIETLKKYNFNAYGLYEETKENNFQEFLLPTIIQLKIKNYYHFVVLLKITKTKVLIMDPAKGKTWLSKKDFLEKWTGFYMVIYPKGPIPKIPQNKKSIFSFKKAFIHQKKLILILTIISFLTIIISLIIANSWKYLLEQLEYSLTISYLTSIFIILLIITIIKIILENNQEKIKITLEKYFLDYYLNQFFHQLYSLTYPSFINYTKGQISTKIKEVSEISIFLLNVLSDSFWQIILIIFCYILVIKINIWLSIYLLFSIIVYLLVGIIKGHKIYLMSLENLSNEEEWYSSIIDNIEIYPSVKHLHRENQFLKRIINKENNYSTNKYYLKNYLRTNLLFQKLIFELTFYLSNIIFIYFISINKNTIYDFLLFQSILSLIITSLKDLIDLVPSIYYLKSLINKANEFFNLPTEEFLITTNEQLRGDIHIKNLQFSYNNYFLIIDNFNLTIKENEHVILLGFSGCGKSTLCQILQRQLTNYQGIISINNKNLLSYSLDTIRNNITYLSQNEQLMNGTIKDNILFGHPAETNSFNLVCQICEIDSFISKRPMKYDEYICKEECNLSGGQIQRLILARTLLKNSPILLLDECLSEVDIPTEEKIINNIHKYYSKTTIIYISHHFINIPFRKINFMKGGDTHAKYLSTTRN